MLINDYIKKIKKLGACGGALKDALNYETLEQLWADCERGDWMLWLVGKLSGEVGDERRKQLVLTACKCARLSLRYVQEGELRPLRAIEAAEQWARGEDGITLEDVISAASAAYDAANAAYAAASAAPAAYAAASAAYDAASAAAYAAARAASAAASAAYAAASAANAAANAASAAYDAASAAAYAAARAASAAASAAAYAASAAAYEAAYNEVLKQCAGIVRADYPNVDDLFRKDGLI